MNVRRPSQQTFPSQTFPQGSPAPEESPADPFADHRPLPGTPKWLTTDEGLIQRNLFGKPRTIKEARSDVFFSACWMGFWLVMFIPGLLNDLARPDTDRSLLGFVVFISIPIFCFLRRCRFYFRMRAAK